MYRRLCIACQEFEVDCCVVYAVGVVDVDVDVDVDDVDVVDNE